MSEKLTPEQFEELVAKIYYEEHGNRYDDLDDVDMEEVWSELTWIWDGDPFKAAGFETVEDHGGGEGSGEERWVVVKYRDQYFRKLGWYASYDGSHFDGKCEEVFPAKVLRTEWTTSPTDDVIDNTRKVV